MTIQSIYHRQRTWLGLVIIGAVLAGAAPAYAQVDTGAIVGTVRDQTGAVVPRVRVTLLNQGTAFTLFT